jgi:hypothetical protein
MRVSGPWIFSMPRESWKNAWVRTIMSHQISAEKPDSRWIYQEYPRVKTPVYKGEKAPE